MPQKREKLLKKEITGMDLKNIFFSTSFDLPEGFSLKEQEIAGKIVFPQGYYSYLEKVFAMEENNLVFRTKDNKGSFVGLLDQHGKDEISKSEKFFRNGLLRHCPHFDETCVINSVYVQKAGMRESKKYAQFNSIEESDIRIVICIKNETDPNYTLINMGGTSDDRSRQILKKESYAVALFKNMSKFDIEISDTKSNGKLKLAEAYYIIIDVTSGAEFYDWTINNLIRDHPTDIEKILPKLKNSDFIKNQMPGIVDKFNGLMEKKQNLENFGEVVESQDYAFDKNKVSYDEGEDFEEFE